MPIISPDEAWSRLRREAVPLPESNRPPERSLGRVLSAAVAADVDIPPCDMSAMDGYVVSEPVEAQTTLAVSATIAAGDEPGTALAPGTAARIMTGAPVPPGAEAVVPVEETDAGETQVTFTAPSKAGAHIRRHGEVVRAGDEILSPGTVVTPAVLGLLAAHGATEVPVHGAPRVATLSTGDEIVPPDRTPGPGQLRDSHTAFLLAAGATLGLDFTGLGIARDTPVDLDRHISNGLSYDVLLISGGVSKGIFDLVEDVLDAHGCETLFDAVAIQPGKPMVAARHERGWVFGLPGNPASAMVCFWLFVRPFLRRLMGFEDDFWRGALSAELEAPLPPAKGRDRFLTAAIEPRGGKLYATPQPPMGSHDVVAYGRGSALVRIPALSGEKSAGDECEVLPVG